MASHHTYNKEHVNNDFATPLHAWEDIIKYIPKDKKIWCPFYMNGDHTLKQLGFDIIHEDEDFFENNKGEIVVDNPPFSRKKDIINRLILLDKPFILIMPVSTLCYQYFKPLKDDIQIIVPPKRINFEKSLKSSACFDCLYFCYKMNLYQDIIFLS